MLKGLRFALAISLGLAHPAMVQAQTYPPGTFSVDGIPISCGAVTFVVDGNLPDVGMARPGLIFLNPNYFQYLSTPLKLYWVGHECGHHVVGANESAADCWAIRTGRNQGWFPPAAFWEMIEMFRNNPGDIMHPPGWARVQQMIHCYQT